MKEERQERTKLEQRLEVVRKTTHKDVRAKRVVCAEQVVCDMSDIVEARGDC